MKLHTSNETCFVLAETGLRKHGFYTTLRCVSKDGAVVTRELPGNVTGLLLRGNKLLCLAEQREKRYKERIVLYTFDTKLQELSSEMLADGSYGLRSAMDAEYIYILDTDTTGVDLGDDPRSCDEVCMLAFTKISIATGERTEWVLDDAEENMCHDALIDLTNGYVTGVDALHAFDGKLMLTCSVYEPGSEIESDDPDFDENALDDSDYVERHSFPETICADVDAQKLSSVHSFYSEAQELGLKHAGALHDESILNMVSAGTRTYVATERRFLCVDSRDGKCLVTSWHRMGMGRDGEDAPHRISELYRHFYLWGNELIFENRKGGKLTGFRICLAQFEEPKAEMWRVVELD